jgi:hypothetical protein
MLRPDKLFATTIAVLLSTVLAAPAALADPPGYAPAKGRRAQQQQPYYAGYDSRRGNCNGDDVGTVLGAIGGGAIGSQVAKGDNQVIAIIAGAAIGGVLGHQIGRAGDPGCNGRGYPAGRAGVPIRGYYPQRDYRPVYYPAPRQVYYPAPRQAHYPAPRQAYAVPSRRPVYVVTPQRPVYAVGNPRHGYAVAPHRQDDRHDNSYRQDDRHDKNCRRDPRRQGDRGKHGNGCG